MASLIHIGVCFWLLLGLCCGATVDDMLALQTLYTTMRTKDPTIFAASVYLADTYGPIQTASQTFGSAQYTGVSTPMTDSSSFRINALSETFVAASVLKLAASGKIPFSVNEAIPSAYLPKAVTDFYNPGFPLTKITLQMLLQHTSTISDVGFTSLDYLMPIASGPVSTLKAFCESYFTTVTSTGASTTKSSIWTSSQPGQTASYLYAKANVALLTYVLDVAVGLNGGLVASSNKTAAAYIQEQIFSPLGMTGSFLLNQSGSRPTLSYPFGSPAFSGAAVEDLTSAGITDTNTLIHPAYTSDYMYYSTTSDIVKFLRNLMLAGSGKTTAFSAASVQMTQGPITIPSTSTLPSEYVKGQGMGVFHFDPVAICAALKSEFALECPFKSTATLWGHVSKGQQGMVGYLCTSQSSSVNPLCAVSQVSHFSVGTGAAKSSVYLHALAGRALYSVLAVTSVNVYAGVAYEQPGLYPFYVILGVIGALSFVVAASYIAEHLIHPAPIVAAVPPQSLPVPQHNAYGGGIAPPTHQHGFYDQ